MDPLLTRLRYHRDQVAALAGWGNSDGGRAAAAQAALDAAAAEIPAETARLRAAAADAPDGGAELLADADALDDFAAPPPPEPAQLKKKGRARP